MNFVSFICLQFSSDWSFTIIMFKSKFWKEVFQSSSSASNISRYLLLFLTDCGRPVFGNFWSFPCSNVKKSTICRFRNGLPYYKMIIKAVTCILKRSRSVTVSWGWEYLVHSDAHSDASKRIASKRSWHWKVLLKLWKK